MARRRQRLAGEGSAPCCTRLPSGPSLALAAIAPHSVVEGCAERRGFRRQKQGESRHGHPDLLRGSEASLGYMRLHPEAKWPAPRPLWGGAYTAPGGRGARPGCVAGVAAARAQVPGGGPAADPPGTSRTTAGSCRQATPGPPPSSASSWASACGDTGWWAPVGGGEDVRPSPGQQRVQRP